MHAGAPHVCGALDPVLIRAQSGVVPLGPPGPQQDCSKAVEGESCPEDNSLGFVELLLVSAPAGAVSFVQCLVAAFPGPGALCKHGAGEQECFWDVTAVLTRFPGCLSA